MDLERELRTLASAARPRAALLLGVAAAVTAVGAGYVVVLATVLGGEGLRFFAFLAGSALGAIPLIIGLTAAVRAGARLAALGQVAAHPERVVAAELAFRFGTPAVRLCLHDGRAVVIASGELDRSALDRAIRARLDGAGPVGPYR